MTPKIIIPPTLEPISVEEARQHLEDQPYSDTDVDPLDDAMIERWIIAAREFAENFTGLSFSPRTLEVALDEFPASRWCGLGRRSRRARPIELPRGPVTAIVSVIAGEESDGPLDPGVYMLDDFARPNAVRALGASWPAFTATPNGIRIRYEAGYALTTEDAGEMIPQVAVAAMLLIIGHLYANREDTTDVALQSIPNGAEVFLRPLRVSLGMA